MRASGSAKDDHLSRSETRATIHLVIGAGPVGSEVATRLASAGKSVVIVTRRGSDPHDSGIRTVAADASSVDALLAAAFLSYAERTGAVLATCSNLYGYGPVTGRLTESLPLASHGTKGQIRAAMRLDAQALHEAGRIRATEVRGSDYICAGEQ